jgi:hypothetical protein
MNLLDRRAGNATGAELTPGAALVTVYVSVYVSLANTGAPRRKRRQVDTHNLVLCKSLPDTARAIAWLWIRRVLVRAQEGQLS